MKKWLTIILVILGILVCSVLIFNANVEVEYVPESEIEDVDLRKTMVTLYFENSENKELQKESRLVDSKILLTSPYEELINMLIEGPASSFLQKTVPEGTNLISTELKGDCLHINFSKSFVDNASRDEKERENAIYSVVNTVCELNEVNSVKFLIEGEEDANFDDKGIDFSNEFFKLKY